MALIVAGFARAVSVAVLKKKKSAIHKMYVHEGKLMTSKTICQSFEMKKNEELINVTISEIYKSG